MKLGSKGRGGRRYQIAAAILTYASVSLAAVPVAIHQYREHPTKQTAPPSNSAAAEHPYPGDAPPQKQSTGFGTAIVTLVGIGLASPFLELSDGFGGIIGLFILFIGIRAAWNLMAGHDFATDDISGPYSTQSNPI